jgi:DNA-binding XRE family transcriptional regulator
MSDDKADGKADDSGSSSSSSSGSEAPGIPFGRWLKQTRQQRGIGTTQFAELIGCSTITLLKIEAGERRPSRQIAELLAEHLRVPPDE